VTKLGQTTKAMLGLLVLAASAFVAAVTMASCEQPKRTCLDHGGSGWTNVTCHEDQRAEIVGNVILCRCVRPTSEAP
jgi:hypothetical protein